MKAMLLAAGVGRRMYPLTLTRPKPTLPVLGRPILVQALHWLRQKGVDEAVINLHHLPDSIRGILANGKFPGLPDVSFSHEQRILGTAGGIREAASALRGDGAIVICNSDFLSDIDLATVVRAHEASDRLATLVLIPWRPGYSVVLRDTEDRVTHLGGQAAPDNDFDAERWMFTGCHVIDESVLDLIPSGRPSCIVADVYRPLVEQGRVGSWAHDGFWWEFGSPRLYLDGCLRLLALPPDELNRISTDHDAIRSLGDALAAVGPGVEVDDSVRTAGGITLGYGTYVSEHATLEDTVVMPESWIGPRCDLRRTVIGEGVELPASFQAENEWICVDPDPDLEVPPGTRREAGMLRCSLDGGAPG